MLPNAETRMPFGFSIRLASNNDISAIRAVLLAVRTEYGVVGEMGANDADLNDLNLNYFRGGGCFEVIEDERQRIVGCAGLYPLDPCRAELCKMYIKKAARGQGLGKRLLEDLLAVARRSGFQEVCLETNSVLREAIALYEKYGFRRAEVDHLPPRCDVAYLLRL
jgi:putative acetyltransferase